MFKEKDIDAFKSIKAPKELKIEIESTLSKKKKETYSKRILSLAASFAIIISVLAFSHLSSNKVSLSYGNKVITEKALSLSVASPFSLQRSADLSFSFDIKADKGTEISVSSGLLSTEEAGEAVQRLIISKKGTTTCYLSDFDITDIPLKLTVKAEKNEAVYTIDYSDETGFTISKDAK